MTPDTGKDAEDLDSKTYNENIHTLMHIQRDIMMDNVQTRSVIVIEHL